METTKPTPTNYEEWLDSAPIEERMKGLYERLQELNIEVAAQKSEIEELKRNRNFLLGILQQHKHDLQGSTMFPNNIVNFKD